jgi:prophage regulatory protein
MVEVNSNTQNQSGSFVPRRNPMIPMKDEEAAKFATSAIFQDGDKTPRELIRILRLPEVINRVGLKRASIYHAMAHSDFPKQIVLSARAVGWIEQEIDTWLAVRIQKRGE